MAKLLSLYGKTLSLVTTVFLISFTVLGLAFMSISASEERDNVRDLERTILLANSYVRDFIITRNPSFAKDTELALQQANRLIEEGIRTENYQRLHNEVLMYLHSINNLIEVYQEQGFYEDDGIEGRIRELSSVLEQRVKIAGETTARVALLEARRHEKNFVLRGHDESVSGVHASIDEMMQELSRSSMSQEEIATIFGEMADYQHNFDKLVSLKDRMDWTRDQLEYFRTAIDETLETVIAVEQVRAQRFLWASLGLILGAFVFGIVYSMKIARDVIKPLEHLRNVVRRVADGEDIERISKHETGDLTELMEAFEEVSEQVRMRREAEKDLTESKAAIQQYANELESRTEQLDLAIQNLKSSKSDAEVASKRKAEFLASMSHEIRTPLNGIIGMTSLLSTEELKADQKEVVDVIRTSGESLLSIVNHILDFSKIEAGGVQLESEEFELSNCVEDSISMISRQAADKGLDVSFQVTRETPRNVLGDSARLRQILVNLLGNAVKFTQEGEVNVQVSCSARGANSARIRFEVKDTGIGIEAEKLKTLFNPFIQAELSTTRRFGGTGLGLSISHGLVMLMDGEMSVESVPGKGSTFGFEITVQLDKSAAEEPAYPVYADQKVLILNEAPMFGAALVSTFDRFGIESVQTTSEEEAISRLQSEPYFAVFINEGKHGFDGVAGVAIAGMIRKVSPSIPIVVLRHINQQMLSGSTLCLLKPIRRMALRDMLLNIADQTGAVINVTPAVAEHRAVLKVVDRPALPLKKHAVLLVEDNLVNQKVGVRMIEKIGCRVDVVDRGEKAIQAVQSGKYAVVFMDIQMPGMDGLEATRQIRNLGDIVQPSIVALTANATTEDRAQCLQAGMDDYAAKPINPKTLELMIRHWAEGPGFQDETVRPA